MYRNIVTFAEFNVPNSIYDIDKIDGTRAAVSTSSKTIFNINMHDMTLCYRVANQNPVHGLRHVNG